MASRCRAFGVPALTTRRAETHVELRDGQSFAIAGLLDNLTQDNGAGIPILSKLPIIGNLFKSKSERAERTELMVLITPRLVRPLDPDEVPPLPTLPKRFLGAPGSGGIGEQIEGGAGLVDAPDIKAHGKDKKPATEAGPVRMSMRSRERFGSERGAVFVQVGIAMFVLVAFNVFVLDYGVMWIARGQAQAAADAGALAGAVARSYDDFDPTPSTSGEIAQLAKATAAANLIWNLPAAADVPSFGCPAGAPPGRCVRVDVYRDGTHGSTALPTIFGPLLGVNSQGVKATAIGFSGNGNATNCLRPLAFADDWFEQHNPLNQFNAYLEPRGTPLGTPDTYATPGSTISGFFGQRIDFDPISDALADPITHGMLVPLDFHGGGTAVDYQNDIEGCNGQLHAIGEQVPLMGSPGSLGGTSNDGHQRSDRG